MEWQRIETAPKDETFVLVCGVGWATPVIAHWRMNHAVGAECWNEPDGGAYLAKWAPTHWMPLPDPPA